MRVLVVEDDPEISRFLIRGLVEERYVVDLVEDGASAVDMVAAEEYDAIVLDLMLPGVDGLEVCRRLRARGVDTPIIMVTARDALTDRVAGLDGGADDYLTKPFAFEELLARLRALGRRGRTRQMTHVLQYGPVTLDPVAHTAAVNGAPLTLTATEYRLLEFLLRRPEAIVTRDQLAQHVWGGEYDPTSNNADVYVGYVRRKLLALAPEPLIHTVRGLGYMLKREARA
ncbi:MAG: response regulator transcription factor [Vicinamibacterales bacterium]|jgi:DNA-binding response OmpR family regulator|nr:response regulator transcription factor [Vicinamibacterales bacterium]